MDRLRIRYANSGDDKLLQQIYCFHNIKKVFIQGRL